MTGLASLTNPGLWLIAIGIAIVVFGFLPGVFTRLLARAYPKGDPRRAEMIAELYAVPRGERPMWVGEQFERVLFEAVPARLRLSKSRRWEAKIRRPKTVFTRRAVLALRRPTRPGRETGVRRHVPVYPGALAMYGGGRKGDGYGVFTATRVSRLWVTGVAHTDDGTRVIRFRRRFVVGMVHHTPERTPAVAAGGLRRAETQISDAVAQRSGAGTPRPARSR